jgi:hypothetical protein
VCGKPRPPRTRPRAVTGFSYAAVLKASMERANSHDFGNRGGFQCHFGGSTASQGNGQGAMFGRGGYPSVNGGFLLGCGGRGPFMGGGGRFGSRDHPGGWVPQHRPTYGNHGGRVGGATEGHTPSFGENRDRVESGGGAQLVDSSGKGKALSIPNSAATVGALSLGGKNLDIPEQAAQLLHNAFDAVKEVSVSSSALADRSATGNKVVGTLEQIK